MCTYICTVDFDVAKKNGLKSEVCMNISAYVFDLVFIFTRIFVFTYIHMNMICLSDKNEGSFEAYVQSKRVAFRCSRYGVGESEMARGSAIGRL